ncbi:DUF2627 domain-containing protein [Bacillus salitolerans]|uniref:DUF2627 domain-containing protein n=1 Tax=Bacillus salitolerans TaxID=1437434 RepID=A0ABW4LMK6_9BACI
MQRYLALIVVVIPVIMAVMGIKLIRDLTFGILQPPIPFLWLQFFIGLALIGGGLWLVGGFVFYRDKKRNKVQQRFQPKK